MIDTLMGAAPAAPILSQGDGLTQALMARQLPQVPSNGIWAKMMPQQRQGANVSQPPLQSTPGALTTSLVNAAQAPNVQPPPNPHTKVPQAAKRWENGQQIQKAYANNWQPNPVLLRASLGR